jgi:hypothetical protein
MIIYFRALYINIYIFELVKNLVTYQSFVNVVKLFCLQIKPFILSILLLSIKKSLKIPKGNKKVNLRRTDNTMAKRKKIKGQTTIYNTLHRKLKIK